MKLKSKGRTKMKTKIIAKIKQLRIDREATDCSDEKKKLKAEILTLRSELENVILKEICGIEINPENYENLTKKQQSFYKDIFDFLKTWADNKAPEYIQLERVDRKVPSKEEIKITIKRIGELLSATWNTKSFSNLVDDFSFIKNGNLFLSNGKYNHLRKDF